MPCKKTKLMKKIKAGKPKHGLVKKYTEERPLKSATRIDKIPQLKKVKIRGIK